MSGAIRPQEIAREAEELMKEFASNPSFVDMMDGIKSAFGFEDMAWLEQLDVNLALDLAMVKERLRKKASEKGITKVEASSQSGGASLAQSEAAMAALLREESLRPSGGANGGANSVKKSQKKSQQEMVRNKVSKI
jgi:hypothetical protein